MARCETQASKRKHRSQTGNRDADMETALEIVHGHICEIHPEKGFGRIETQDGRVIVFYKDSVVDHPFAQLTIGAEVRFAEESDKRDIRASVVHVID